MFNLCRERERERDPIPRISEKFILLFVVTEASHSSVSMNISISITAWNFFEAKYTIDGLHATSKLGRGKKKTQTKAQECEIIKFSQFPDDRIWM